MTFPYYYLVMVLNSMGWPRKTGLFIRREVVSHSIVWVAVEVAVGAAIALGAARPRIALALLANLFTGKDWSLQTATELWSDLDPSEEVAAHPDESLGKIIAQPPMSVLVHLNSRDMKKDLVRWKYVSMKEFVTLYHWIFCRGLVWGLSHPREALDRHEKQRQQLLQLLPEMLQHDLEVHSPDKFDVFLDETEELVNSYQNEIRPLAEVPQVLLDLPIIRARFNQPET